VLPPVLDALASLLPDLLATQIMIQYQLVGQLYTQLHEYCQAHQLPSPAPAMELVMSAFEAEYTRIREDLERNIKTVAEGKAVHQPMSIPDKQHGTVTGLGLRNNFARRTSSQGSMPRPTVPGQLRIGGAASEDEVDTTAVRPRRPGRISSNSRLHSHYEKTATKQSHYEDEEAPPVKPPRPGAAPMIDATGKPRISSSSKVAGLSAGEGYSTASSTPSSSSTPLTLRQGCDYFSQEGRASAGSGSYGVAGKKKPPPPPPKKRALSSQGQYVTALYDYAGQGEGDLSFAEGDRIKVVKKTASIDDWWEGELNGVGGSFPANYVKVD
jgi:amphiphysin